MLLKTITNHKNLKYKCGCSFRLLESKNNSIEFIPDINHLNLECEKTWNLLSSGNTKGCFQLESRLGRSIAKKLKPQNMEQLSALIAILRPGCLEAYRDGKSVTQHYIDKKNGEESIDYYHSSIRHILEPTYGEMIYQEQAMEIAKVIAGFDLREADMLRKAIGKKKPEEMAKIKTKFLEGSKNQKIVTENEAEQIFGWIEKSQRYSFNKSHSVSYAMNAYLSAYAKAHFPKIFFASYLRYAKDKIDPQSEIKELIQNANQMDIIVSIPDIRKLNRYFTLEDNKIYFGLTDIKGLGDSVYEKILNITNQLACPIKNITWIRLLSTILVNINSTAAKALIESGATSFVGLSRTKMLFDFEIISKLTKKELQYILDHIDDTWSLDIAIRYLLDNAKLMKQRRKLLEDLLVSLYSPPYSMQDSIEWLSNCENTTLGYSITCSKIDVYDISMTNVSCKDFNKKQETVKTIIIAGEIDFINVTKTKTGKNPGLEMCFATITDSTASLDSIIFFPEQYVKYKNILYPNNIVILQGIRSKTGDGLIVEKAYIPKS